jgi:predicted phosphodiesterase
MRNAALLAVAACALCAGPAAAQQIYVRPYVQPGDGRTLTGTDTKVICWVTDQTPGEFVVEFTAADATGSVKPVRVQLDFPPLKVKALPVAPPPHEIVGEPKRVPPPAGDEEPPLPKVPLPPEAEQKFFLYAATLTDLPFDTTVTYRVKLGAKVVREAAFRTRATAEKAVRCVLVGDLAQGRDGQKPIAYRIAQEKPEFLVALGDIVYPQGRMNQYTAFYWHTYNNVPDPSPRTGAPLMATVPFYVLLGNHDIAAKPATVPDGLAAYYFFHTPRNGPGDGPWATPLGVKGEAEKQFRANTLGNYPALDAYSFDYGPAHFTLINDNTRLAITDPAFLKWLRADLTGTTARWKFVCYHVPGFQGSKQHYTEQQARQLQPLFEECGVDATFAGHVHNYQRSVPLKFAPDGKGPVRGKVNGTFTLDTEFDGQTHTAPSGVIHFVAGGGGASLYGPAPEKVAAELKKLHGDNFAPFTAKATADRHSFVVLDLAPDKLELRALGDDGQELDKIVVTKKK